MAVLGSTVDPRLGAVSPAAIQALSQAGAATGQMYANLGRSIAGVVQDQAQRKTDAKIAQIIDESTIDEVDEEGKPTGFTTLDQSKFRKLVSEKKVPPGLANTILQDTLSAWKTEADFRTAQQDLAIKLAAQEATEKYQTDTVALRKDELKQEGELAGQELSLRKEIADLEAETRKTISADEIAGRLKVVNAQIDAEKKNLQTQLKAAKGSQKREIKAEITQLNKTLRQNKMFHRDKMKLEKSKARVAKKKSDAEIGEIKARERVYEGQADETAVDIATKTSELAETDPLYKRQRDMDVYTASMSDGARQAFEAKTPFEKAMQIQAELTEAEADGDRGLIEELQAPYSQLVNQAKRDARTLGQEIPNFRPAFSFLQSPASIAAEFENRQQSGLLNMMAPGGFLGPLNPFRGDMTELEDRKQL